MKLRLSKFGLLSNKENILKKRTDYKGFEFWLNGFMVNFWSLLISSITLFKQFFHDSIPNFMNFILLLTFFLLEIVRTIYRNILRFI